ncbi:hypothetical protein P7C70_g9536, partial [Phenoliferia sp. Uapishka_3]
CIRDSPSPHRTPPGSPSPPPANILTRANIGSRHRPTSTDVLDIDLLNSLLLELQRPDRAACFVLPFEAHIKASVKSALDRPLRAINPPEAHFVASRPVVNAKTSGTARKWVAKGTTGSEGGMVVLPTPRSPVPPALVFPPEVVNSVLARLVPTVLETRWFPFLDNLRAPGKGELRCHAIKDANGHWLFGEVVCTYPTAPGPNVRQTTWWPVVALTEIGTTTEPTWFSQYPDETDAHVTESNRNLNILRGFVERVAKALVLDPDTRPAYAAGVRVDVGVVQRASGNWEYFVNECQPLPRADWFEDAQGGGFTELLSKAAKAHARADRLR